jgi:RNA polymerase sigma factor (sigma-70 family)
MIRFGPLVARTARRHSFNVADAEDVVQEVWVALLNNLDRLHSPACLPGWLHRVTVNAAIQHGRRCGRSLPFSEVPERAVGHDDDEAVESLVREAKCHSVQSALDRLKPPDRELLALLMDGDRPDYAGISRRTRRPVGSIGPTRRRLLDKLGRDPAIASVAAG